MYLALQVMFSTDGYAFPETFYLGSLTSSITPKIMIIPESFVSLAFLIFFHVGVNIHLLT
jgi:hypothetical protein